MLTRRGFLASGATVPLAAAAPVPSAHPSGAETISLNGIWLFRFDAETKWREVRVPHTWQVEPENTGRRGVAWYRHSFHAPPAWSERTVRIEFEAVFPNPMPAAEPNPHLRSDPAGIVADPYGAGWLARIRPSALAAERGQLADGVTAFTRYQALIEERGIRCYRCAD